MCIGLPEDVMKFQDAKGLGEGNAPRPILPKAKAQKPKKTGDETPTPDEEQGDPVKVDQAETDIDEDDYEDEGDEEAEEDDGDHDDGDDDDDGDDEDDDDRESEYCPFCKSLNYWGEMDVCGHHIGMEFDGNPESAKLNRLVEVWMSLAGKLESLGENTQKKWAEISGASPKTIRLFLQNVDEGHEFDLYPEDDLADVFGLQWGGTICQSQGMLGSSATSIYCKNPSALEKHIQDLEKLDKVVVKKIPPDEEQ